ncbi:MAG: hypothetical protein K1X94_01675 [Sandaracinaceae bacterium]|nr:hypothetical protein [Sandaracinaceae bacterium]
MKLPPAEAVSHMLTDLLGRACIARSTAKPGFADQGIIGVLVNRAGETKALTFSDRSFVSLTGAALALIPRTVAEEAVKKGVIPPSILENHQEIINIATTLFNAIHSDAEHLKLGPTVATGPACPQALRTFLVKPAARLDLEVEITGYGTGKLSLLV